MIYDWDALFGDWEMKIFRESSGHEYTFRKGKKAARFYCYKDNSYEIMTNYNVDKGGFGWMSDLPDEIKISFNEYVFARYAQAVEDYKLGKLTKAQQAKERLEREISEATEKKNT